LAGGTKLLTLPDHKFIMGLFWQWFKKVGHVILPRNIRAEGVFGTGDPFYTGLLAGAYEATVGMLNLREKIRLCGDFDRSVLELSVDVSGRMSLIQIIRPTIWLILQKPVRKFIKEYIKKS
jgi:hypothetical protein